MDKPLAEQLAESRAENKALKDDMDVILGDYQTLYKDNHTVGVKHVILKMQVLENSIDTRFAKVRKDPEVAVLKERVDQQKASLLKAYEAMHKIKGRLDALENPPVPEDMPEFP